MPIRLNLLAEAQALEEQRRRDPVKRAVWAGVVLVALVLVWSTSLFFKSMLIRSEVSGLESQLKAQSKDYDEVTASQKALDGVHHKLASLENLATNRFLNGNLLNALQTTKVPNIQLTHLKVDQLYARVEETKPKTNGTHIVAGKPATITEKILVTLEARDTSPIPGDSVTKYKQAIADLPYFKQHLARADDVRLKDLGTPQTGPDGKSFVLFSLECRYPEITR